MLYTVKMIHGKILLEEEFIVTFQLGNVDGTNHVHSDRMALLRYTTTGKPPIVFYNAYSPGNEPAFGPPNAQ